MASKGLGAMPICKRYSWNRKQRLQATLNWIKNFQGTDVVRSYRRHFRVSRLCALIELQMAGCTISQEQIENARKSEDAAAKARAKRKEKAELLYYVSDVDSNFAYIAGYTSWGFPYGVTWEELEGEEWEP